MITKLAFCKTVPGPVWSWVVCCPWGVRWVSSCWQSSLQRTTAQSTPQLLLPGVLLVVWALLLCVIAFVAT